MVIDAGLAQQTGSHVFVVRECCPICHESHVQTLLSIPYTDPTLRAYLTSQFDWQGGIDFALLERADFTVLKCPTCRLIFQRLAPGGRLLAALYNEFIDPVRLK